MINSMTGNKTPLDLRPARDWDRSGKRFGDPAKAREKLGFVAAMELETGIARTIAWTRDNLPTIKRCMGQHRALLPAIGKYLD